MDDKPTEARREQRRAERAEDLEERRVERADDLEERRVVRAEDLARELKRFRMEVRLLYILAFAVIALTN